MIFVRLRVFKDKAADIPRVGKVLKVDQVDAYGFVEARERSSFNQLIDVNL